MPKTHKNAIPEEREPLYDPECELEHPKTQQQQQQQSSSNQKYNPISQLPKSQAQQTKTRHWFPPIRRLAIFAIVLSLLLVPVVFLWSFLPFSANTETTTTSSTLEPAPLLKASPARIMSSPLFTQEEQSRLSTLSNNLKLLRSRRGHFQGGDEFIADVDGFNGAKHAALKELGELLGRKGVLGGKVVEVMGPPDEIVPSKRGRGDKVGEAASEENMDVVRVGMMPGPVVGGSGPGAAMAQAAGEPYYLIYYWRGRHDYLHFLVDENEQVVRAGWYTAGE